MTHFAANCIIPRWGMAKNGKNVGKMTIDIRRFKEYNNIDTLCARYALRIVIFIRRKTL